MMDRASMIEAGASWHFSAGSRANHHVKRRRYKANRAARTQPLKAESFARYPPGRLAQPAPADEPQRAEATQMGFISLNIKEAWGSHVFNS